MPYLRNVGTAKFFEKGLYIVHPSYKKTCFDTFGNLIRNELTTSIEQIFADINSYIF